MTNAERSRAYRQRKLDAGYRLLHGRLTLDPIKNRIGEPPPHGTARRYQSRSFPCRCRECTTAVADAHRAWRATRDDRQPAP